MIELLIFLILVAFVFWLIDLIPGDATVKQIIKGVCILLIVLFVIQVLFGYTLIPLHLHR